MKELIFFKSFKEKNLPQSTQRKNYVKEEKPTENTEKKRK